MKLRTFTRMLARTNTSIAVLLALACTSVAQVATPEKLSSSEKPIVRVNVMVTDAKGRTVADVKREDLRVYEDGVEQPIAYFSKEEQPVTYGLVVDNSGSLREQMAYVVASAKLVVNSNTPEDETFVVRFISSDNINVTQDFTSDKTSLFKALDSMYVQRGQTAVIDAVYLAVNHMVKNGKTADGKPRRRVLVLISDGEDRASYYKAEDLFKLLKGSDIQIFCVGLTAALDKERGFISKSKRDRASDFLKRLASETGGRIFFAEKVGELEEAIGEVLGNLHMQYVVGYDPPANAGGKTKHKIEVKVIDAPGRGKLKAIVRPERTDASAEGKKKKQ
ncbi:MAG: VWA domain-containing protein [Rubrivivax sp.]|nr:VWA domain-containing protein [Pyrinomonadaceae bacterium]